MKNITAVIYWQGIVALLIYAYLFNEHLYSIFII